MDEINWHVASAVALLAINLRYIAYCHRLWERHFKNRVHRSHPTSPSNGGRPSVTPEERKLQAVATSTRRPSIVAAVTDRRLGGQSLAARRPPSPPHLKDRSVRRATIVSPRPGAKRIFDRAYESAAEMLYDPAPAEKRRLCTETQGTLDMDHVHVPFVDFLWGMYFLAPNGVVLWATGIAVLKVKKLLRRLGLWRAAAYDPDALIAELLLESFQAMHYTCQRVTDDGRRLANFSFTRFPYLEHGVFKVSCLFTVCVDLDRRRFVKATLSDEALSAREALILVYFNAITADHVKIHAFSNWAANIEQQEDPFLYRMSLISIMYNFFGHSLFPKICGAWESLGVCEHSLADVRKVFRHGVREGVSSHAQVGELAQDSNIVSFVIKVRNKFLNAFQRHRDDFLGIDGEALFVGTVVHSLDHQVLEWLLPDPLWMEPETLPKRFRAMAEVSRLVRVGFVPEPPLQLFRKRMRDAPGPFYRTVYAHAARIDKRLADHMDACIAK